MSQNFKHVGLYQNLVEILGHYWGGQGMVCLPPPTLGGAKATAALAVPTPLAHINLSTQRDI